MTGQAMRREDRAKLGRRVILKRLACVVLGGTTILLAGCANSVPPRDYKRPPSARFYGGNGKRD